MGCETALADEFYFMPIFEIDMTAPCPCVCVRILLYYADKWLIAMAVLNSVSLPVFWAGLHSATVVVVENDSKRMPDYIPSLGPFIVNPRAVYEFL